MSRPWDIARASDAISVAALCAAAIIVPVVYVPALATPFTTPKDAVLQIAAALCWGALALRVAALGRAALPGPIARHVVGAAVLVLATLAASTLIAASRSPGPSYAGGVWLKWGALFGIACGGAAAARYPEARTGLLQAVTTSAAVVSAIGLWQHLDLRALPIPVLSTPGSTFGNRNLGAEAVALALPMGLAALLLARTRWEMGLATAAVALELLYLAATRTRGAWIGGTAGILTFALISRSCWRRSTVFAAPASLALVAPALILTSALTVTVALLPGRWNPRYAADSKRLANGMKVVETAFDLDSTALRTRIGLWRRSLRMFGTAPVTGIGPGNWAVAFPQFAEPEATAAGVLGPALSPRHAHDDPIECLTETGLLGATTLVLLGAAVIRGARQGLSVTDDPQRLVVAAASGTLIALVCTGLTGFPLEMPGTVLLAGLALGLISSQPQPQPQAPVPVARPPRAAGGAGALAVAGLVALALVTFAIRGAERRIRGSWWLSQAERALRGSPGAPGALQALPALALAEQATPSSFPVALRTAQAALRLHQPVEGTRAATTALAVERYSPNAWAILAAVQLDGGDAVSARATADRSLAILHDYPLALSIRARSAALMGDAAAAAADWSRLAELAAATTIPSELGITDSAKELLEAHRR